MTRALYCWLSVICCSSFVSEPGWQDDTWCVSSLSDTVFVCHCTVSKNIYSCVWILLIFSSYSRCTVKKWLTNYFIKFQHLSLSSCLLSRGDIHFLGHVLTIPNVFPFSVNTIFMVRVQKHWFLCSCITFTVIAWELYNTETWKRDE
jgi:hypothetical protein